MAHLGTPVTHGASTLPVLSILGGRVTVLGLLPAAAKWPVGAVEPAVQALAPPGKSDPQEPLTRPRRSPRFVSERVHHANRDFCVTAMCYLGHDAMVPSFSRTCCEVNSLVTRTVCERE